MKQRIACLLANILLLCATAKSQSGTNEPKNQLSASYGFITTSQIIESLVGVGIAVGSLGELVYTPDSYTGGLFLTYHRSSNNNKIRYGIAIGYDAIKGSFENQSGSKKGTFKNANTTIATEIVVAYLNKPNFRLYGLAGGGYTFNKYENTVISGGSENEQVRGSHVNFQLTPLGAAFGKQFGGFLELGLGYKGLLNIGLFARL